MMEETRIAPADALLSLTGHVQSPLERIYPNLYARAAQALQEMSWPTSRQEDWKYTRTARITAAQWQPGKANTACDPLPHAIPGLECDQVVFVDGHYRADLSSKSFDPALELLTEWKNEEDGPEIADRFQAMRYALCTSALRIRVKKNQRAARSLHILHIVTDVKTYSAPFISLISEQHSELHLVESFAVQNGNSSFTNRSFHISVAEGAHLHLDKIQIAGDEDFLMNEESVLMADNANFTINTLTIEGGWVRNNLKIALNGQNSEANLHGFYLPVKKHFVDNHTLVDHRVPHCNSNELYKGVLSDQSSGVFNGKVYVRPDAQKTNAFQNNANLLTSEDAQMNTKPELEIYADDVKCSHGTTTGQMDEEAVFYLKARGIGNENARRLLTSAFIHDVVNKVRSEAVKSYVIAELEKRGLLYT